MSARLRPLLAAFVALIAVVALAATAAARVEVVQHWALYAATGPGKPYHLFLDPFPDARTCRVESAEVIRAGGRAYCGAHLALSFDPAREQRLLWEFFSPSNPWSKLCGLGPRAQAGVSRPRASR